MSSLKFYNVDKEGNTCFSSVKYITETQNEEIVVQTSPSEYIEVRKEFVENYINNNSDFEFIFKNINYYARTPKDFKQHLFIPYYLYKGVILFKYDESWDDKKKRFVVKNFFLTFAEKHRSEADKLIEVLEEKNVYKPLRIRKDNTINVQYISQGSSGLESFTVNVEDKVKLDINLNYNDDFQIDKLYHAIKSKQNGLLLLGGKPGTGKSTLIRHLIKKYGQKRDFYFMPNSLLGQLDSPGFIKFTLKNLKNAILVLEDAENLLLSRDRYKSPAISALLNMTSGTLGMAMNVTVIATYNTEEELDKALSRKGRLIYSYTFKELTVEKSNILARTIGSNILHTVPTTVADIYNEEDNNSQSVQPERKHSGFSFTSQTA